MNHSKQSDLTIPLSFFNKIFFYNVDKLYSTRFEIKEWRFLCICCTRSSFSPDTDRGKLQQKNTENKVSKQNPTLCGF